MQFTRKSALSGKVRTRDIDVTAKQLAAWESGMPIQQAMPHLSADDREFILSGITPDEWNRQFGGGL